MIRRAFALLAVLALVAGAATARDAVSRSSEAQWVDQLSSQATMRNSANGRGTGPNPSGYSASSNGGYASGTSRLPWPGAAGANNMAAWKAKARGPDLARAMMNPGSAVVTLLGGMAMKELLDYACVKVAGGVIKEGALWDECNFVTKTGLLHRINSPPYADFPNDWTLKKAPRCEALAMFYKQKNPAGSYASSVDATGANDGVGGGSCTIRNAAFPAGCSGTGCMVVWAGSFQSQSSTWTEQDGYKPITPTNLEPKIAQAYEAQCQSDFTAGLGADSTCPRAFKEVVENGLTVEVEDAEVDVPVHVEGPCVTTKTTHPDGSYTNRTECSGSDYDETGNTVKRTETKTTTTQDFNPDGTPKAPPTTTTDKTVDTRTECEKDPMSVACTSSAVPSVPNLDGAAKSTEVTKPLMDFVKNPSQALPQLPVLNWAFVLPSGCTPIALPAFEPWLQVIDICPFVSMFHDIMTVIWVMGGLFGAISLYWRNTLSQA